MTNLSQFFAHVKDGEILAYNLRRGVQYNGVSFGKESPDEEYIAKGLYPIVGDAPTDYDPFYQRVDGPSYEIGNSVVNRVYTTVDLTVDDIREELIDKVRDIARNVGERPLVDTGLGFKVQGSYRDLQEFEVSVSLGLTFVRDADNVTHNVTTEQLSDILQKIKVNGLSVKQNKWKLVDDLKNASTIEELREIDIYSGWGEVNANS